MVVRTRSAVHGKHNKDARQAASQAGAASPYPSDPRSAMLGSSHRSAANLQAAAGLRQKYSLAFEPTSNSWARANGGLGPPAPAAFDELDEAAASSSTTGVGCKMPVAGCGQTRVRQYRAPAHVDNETDDDTDFVSINIGSDAIAASTVMRRYRRRHPDEVVIKMNLAGSCYLLKADTIFKRLPSSFLYRFSLMTHDDRVSVSAAYFDHTKEYFFERSAIAFEPVYRQVKNIFRKLHRYYATGALHKPVDMCLDDFLDELQFWELPVNALAPCCWSALAGVLHAHGAPQQLAASANSESSQKLPATTEFDHLAFGPARKAVWELIEVPESSVWARMFAIASILFVLVSIGGLVLGSIPELQVEHASASGGPKHDVTSNNVTNHKPIMVPHPAFNIIEYVCIAWFTFEYCGKIIVAAHRWQTLNVIDLFAIAPFYFELSLLIAGIDTENLKDLKGAFLVIRILRVLRVMRIFKLGRYSAGLQTFALTLLSSMKQLGMMSMVLMTGVIFFSTLVYFLEKDEPDTLFTSIPATFWWCIVTMTTVGYGDVVPTTVLGKLVASGAIACGVLVLALPITIIVDNFVKVAEEQAANVTDVADGPASGTPRSSTVSQLAQHTAHMHLPSNVHAAQPPVSGFSRLQRSASIRKEVPSK